MDKETMVNENNEAKKSSETITDTKEVNNTDINDAKTDEQVVSVEEQLAEMKDRWIRAAAELENLRKRAEREKQDAAKYAVTSFAREMLSVSDNLDRALAAITTQEDITAEMKALIEGINMVSSELGNIFERQGISKLNPKGEKFDPNFHQAMFEVPTSELEPGMVVEVIQQGFAMHGRLLRPALVGVSKAEIKESNA